MDRLLTPEAFGFFAHYLLAGFVALSARSWLVAGERPKPNETLVEAVVLSLVNQLLLVVTWGRLAQPGADPLWVLVLQVVAQPLALGLAAGGLARAAWVPSGIRRLLLPASRAVQRPIDRGFEGISAAGFLIVTAADGTAVHGYFGSRSLASTDEGRGGIYLERLYRVEGDGAWVEIMPRRGVWVPMTAVRAVEFIPLGGRTDDQDAV